MGHKKKNLPQHIIRENNIFICKCVVSVVLGSVLAYCMIRLLDASLSALSEYVCSRVNDAAANGPVELHPAVFALPWIFPFVYALLLATRYEAIVNEIIALALILFANAAGIVVSAVNNEIPSLYKAVIFCTSVYIIRLCVGILGLCIRIGGYLHLKCAKKCCVNSKNRTE